MCSSDLWLSEQALVRAIDVRVDEQVRPRFRLVPPAGEHDVELAVHGAHQVGNALTAAAVALELGMSLPDVATGLADARPVSRRRMEVTTRPDGVTVINDAYNANPESMLAALKALAALGTGRRTWAVLGPMGELGADSAARHDEIGRLAVQLEIDRLVAVGEPARPMYEGAHREGLSGKESVLVPDVDAAIALLRARYRKSVV